MSLDSAFVRRDLTVQGRPRHYFYCVPTQVAAAGASAPLVLAFHGSGTHARGMMEFSGLSEKAEQAGFIVVYPNGTGRTEQTCCWNVEEFANLAFREGVDDVAFTAAILDDFATLVPFDQQRVYATGMSNGAMLAYLLADRLSHRIAAIAPVAGTMAHAECHPAQPVPVCHFHGLADEHVPFLGGIGKKSLTKFRFHSVEHSIRAWIAANACNPTPQIDVLSPLVADGTSVVATRYTGGRERSEVLLFAIAGMGHTWPGRQSQFSILGKCTENLSANDAMWAFFQRHRR
jgi:polyhydroxybutyrate depolymerase